MKKIEPGQLLDRLNEVVDRYNTLAGEYNVLLDQAVRMALILTSHLSRQARKIRDYDQLLMDYDQLWHVAQNTEFLKLENEYLWDILGDLDQELRKQEEKSGTE